MQMINFKRRNERVQGSGFRVQEFGVRSSEFGIPALRIPHSALRTHGFTLVELLVVVVILSIITIATIPIVRPALDTRRIREAARTLAAHIGSAQTHAIETGRAAGIWIERLRIGEGASATVEPAAAMDVYLCEVPPPYAGDTIDAQCRVKFIPPIKTLPAAFALRSKSSWI